MDSFLKPGNPAFDGDEAGSATSPLFPIAAESLSNQGPVPSQFRIMGPRPHRQQLQPLQTPNNTLVLSNGMPYDDFWNDPTQGQLVSGFTCSADPGTTNMSPQIIINAFNKDVDTLLPEFSFNATFGESPSQPRIASSTGYPLTLSGSEAVELCRSTSQASSNLQDDTISIAYSASSTGDNLDVDAPDYLTSPIATSVSDHLPSGSAPSAMNFSSSFSPAFKPSWDGMQKTPRAIAGTASPVDSSFAFSPVSPAIGSQRREVPRSVPRRSALSSHLIQQSSPIYDANTPSFAEGCLFSEEDVDSTLHSWIPPQLELGSGSRGLGLHERPIKPITPGSRVRSLGMKESSEGFSSLQPHAGGTMAPPYAQSAPYSSPFVHPAPASTALSRNPSGDGHLRVPSHHSTSAGLGRRRASSIGTTPITIPKPSSRSGGVSKGTLLSSPNPQSKPGRGSLSRSFSSTTSSLEQKLVGSARGKRKRPLNKDARESARKVRNEKSICIRCKLKKTNCHRPDDSPNACCDACEKFPMKAKWPGPCVRACFDDIVLSGGLDFMGQLRVNHTFPDGGTMSHRLSETFHLHELLQRVDRACRQFDIGVAYEGKLIYVINLDQCYEYLTRVNEGLSVSEYDHTLRAFLDRDLLKAEPRAQDWTLLITHLDSALKSDKLALLELLGQITGSATFHYVFKRRMGANGMPLQQRIESMSPARDLESFELAAYLVRIINRKAEVDGFDYLRSRLYSSYSTKLGSSLPTLLKSLGLILIRLRWRVSCLALTIRGMTGDWDATSEALRDPGRTRELCQVLYFYYHAVRRRAVSMSEDGNSPSGSDSLSMRYPNVQRPVIEALPGPTGETFLGFNEWMAQGEEVVRRAKGLDVGGSYGSFSGGQGFPAMSFPAIPRYL